MISIAVLARETSVKVPSVRYYEQMGLLDPPLRSAGNQRRYPPEAVERLAFIRHARGLGLPLEAIRELLELSGHPERTCADADGIAERHLEGVRARIARLQSLERELERMLAGCRTGTVRDCHVLRSLADHDLCETDHASTGPTSETAPLS